MFEVICITDGFKNLSCPGKDFPVIERGDIKTVSKIDHRFGRDWYAFADTGSAHLYDSNMFAPLDGPDERDIAEQRWKERELRIRDKVQVLLNQTTPA